MAKKKKSVLAKQRPKKGRKKGGFLRNHSRLLAAVFTGLLILSGTIFYVLRPDVKVIAGKSRDWQLTVRAEDKSLLSKLEEKAIIEAVKANIGDGSRQELIKAVSSIKSMEAFAKVHLVRTGDDNLTLFYSKRVPVMCYSSGSGTLLVSDQAEVYGQLASDQPCPGPQLAGIIEDKKPKPNKFGVIPLSAEEQKQVENALVLLAALTKHEHRATSITYEKYRGFYVNLDNLETDIALGNPPFDTKLEKLGEVLEKIKNRGEVAQRIELDFQGKAFIKLKRI